MASSISTYDSPYVEISDENHLRSEEIENAGKGSINSFLEEAEIITQSTECEMRRAGQKMRMQLRSFFMNPIEKWNLRGRFPWKLCVQLFKIIMATMQMLLFGQHSFNYLSQRLDMTTALSRILLKDWSLDPAVYPPSNGPYAVYTIPEFYERLDFAIQQFAKIQTVSIGPFSYESPDGGLTPMEFCVRQYNGSVFAGNSSTFIEGGPKDNCIWIPPVFPASDPRWDNFSAEDFFNQNNFTLNFRVLVSAKLMMGLKTIFIKSLNKLDFPECYKLKIHIDFDNGDHDGQIVMGMNIHTTKLPCHINSHIGDPGEETYFLLRQILNITVIITCMSSMALCVRSLLKGYSLARETYDFFQQFYQKVIPFWELLDFIDFWFINIVISDILLIIGSGIKASIEEKSAEGYEYAKCSILLGVGNLLIWIGLLRYLGFFPKYNMLILTMKRALPNVLRFLVCAVLLFIGSCFCGWIVMAPYHIKFRSLSRTAECLFAIMNGDDMFATFALLDTQLLVIWYFTRIFLYIFLIVFVYVVVSLFISVIMDTFESIKYYYAHGSPPRSTVEMFLAAEDDYIPISPDSVQEREFQERVSYCQRFWNWLVYNPVFDRERLIRYVRNPSV